jgi:uncharacterized membrane protein
MLNRLLDRLRLRPRLLIAIAIGAVAWLWLPGARGAAGQWLVAWNVTVWLYLAMVGAMMLRHDHGQLRRHAAAHADGAVAVLMLAAAAAVASLLAIFTLLSQLKASGDALAWRDIALTTATVVGSWLLLPVEYALTYASRYYPGGGGGGGLDFPAPAAGDAALPGYAEFLYFSFTIAATAQTSDVAVTSRAMRKLVVAHGVLSFAFNTLVLALAVNIFAGLF